VPKDIYAHISDQELLEKFKKEQDSFWLGILFQRYTLLLLGVCMKYLKEEEAAKDAVQQVFLKAISELSKYEVSYLKSWLYAIARNHCLMQLRDKNRVVSVTDDLMLKEDPLPSLTAAEKEQSLNLLELSLVELNPAQKTCVTLFYLQKRVTKKL